MAENASNQRTLYITEADWSRLEAIGNHLGALRGKPMKRSEVIRVLLDQVMWIEKPAKSTAQLTPNVNGYTQMLINKGR